MKLETLREFSKETGVSEDCRKRIRKALTFSSTNF